MTQNIDDLHERAGSRDVVHMHGELLKARCGRCEGVDRMARRPRPTIAPAPTAVAPARLRPHVVWFGEMPLYMDEIYPRADARPTCSSPSAPRAPSIPAAGFVDEARALGIETCEINLEAADNARCSTTRATARRAETVPAWVEEVLGALTPNWRGQ